MGVFNRILILLLTEGQTSDYKGAALVFDRGYFEWTGRKNAFGGGCP
jgi:hypothetical protein